MDFSTMWDAVWFLEAEQKKEDLANKPNKTELSAHFMLERNPRRPEDSAVTRRAAETARTRTQQM
ncbi:MAG: hypothetical protein E6G81_11055 [Alphaproteobacteria bacterium]|nr:MAG: hypothetical protein E6G81_11055 [Alphaproteobacteria bacterium]